jgi:hypothetical protein
VTLTATLVCLRADASLKFLLGISSSRILLAAQEAAAEGRIVERLLRESFRDESDN